MRGGGDDVRVRHGRRMHATGDEPGEVRHVDDEKCADFVGDLAHAGKVEGARIGAAASDDHLRLFALGNLFELVVVDDFRILAHAVADDAVELAGKIQLVAVGQVAAHGQVEAENGVARLDDRHVRGGVGLGAGVRLHVGVFGAEELFGAIARQRFDNIGILAAAVVALARIALGIFVGEDRARGFKHRLADKVLRGDHLQAFVLAVDFLLDGGVNFRVRFGERQAHAVVGHTPILSWKFRENGDAIGIAGQPHFEFREGIFEGLCKIVEGLCRKVEGLCREVEGLCRRRSRRKRPDLKHFCFILPGFSLPAGVFRDGDCVWRWHLWRMNLAVCWGLHLFYRFGPIFISRDEKLSELF